MNSIKGLIKKCALGVTVLASVAVMTLGVPAYAAPIDPSKEVTKGITEAGGGATTANTLPDLIQTIISVLLFVAGAVAVIMIILGGLRYITSNGDQAQVKAAKETIMYAVIGLVVAILAFAIVQFIVSKL